MSDNRSWKEELQTKLQNSKESSPIHYIFEQRAAGSFLLLKISHKLLLKWRDLKNAFAGASFIDLLHLSTVHLPFSIKPEAERVENCLRALDTKVYGPGQRGYAEPKGPIFLRRKGQLRCNIMSLSMATV